MGHEHGRKKTAEPRRSTDRGRQHYSDYSSSASSSYSSGYGSSASASNDSSRRRILDMKLKRMKVSGYVGEDGLVRYNPGEVVVSTKAMRKKYPHA